MNAPTLNEKVNNVLKVLSQDIASEKLELPTPPDLLLELKKLLNTPDTKVEQIVKILRRDPNISARIIKVANSALFGGRERVKTTRAAVLRLGMQNVHSLAVGLSITQQFLFRKTKGLEKHLTSAWEQGQAVAALAHVLASHKSKIDPEIALLTGLMHNIGMLPLYMRLNSISELQENPSLREKVCERVIPALYPKAGRLIVKSWQFPQEIIDITQNHRDLTLIQAGPISLMDIVAMAYQVITLYQPKADHDFAFDEAFLESTLFKKFWPDAFMANMELNKYAEEIADIRSLLQSDT